MTTTRPATRAKLLFAAFCMVLAFASVSFAQVIPVVTIQATDAHGTWTGDPAVFTVFRSGNLAPALNVYCCISGTASNGVDYQTIGNFVSIPSGVLSNAIVINPINLGQTDTQTVTVDLCPSPLMIPVNYSVGSPSSATIYITPPGISNLPPAVNIVSPTTGAVFNAPTNNIPLIAKAGDLNGNVTNVEFFANGTDIGRGLPVVLDPPGANGVTGLVYFFNWQNVPTNHYTLTAVATDNDGASTTSASVNITVQLPPTNLPPMVRITSPPNGTVYRAPMDVPIYAATSDPDGTVSSVEFFASGKDIGPGTLEVCVAPAGNCVGCPSPAPICTYSFVWSNAPIGNWSLTTVATDNSGLSATSNPVLVSILPPLPPPTNRPPVVRIIATDPVAMEGTNCWTWRGLTSAPVTWSNWYSPTAAFCLFTNCGPKDATISVFRFGDTNDDLAVAYAIGGTATNGVDYAALPDTVTIPAGQRRADITIIPLDDGTPDITSTVILRLIPDPTGTSYLVGFPKAAAAIILDSQSPQAVNSMLPGIVFNISANGPDGAWFHVEYSIDMTHWTPICTNQVINGKIDFVDPDAAVNPARYYRTVPEAGPPPQ